MESAVELLARFTLFSLKLGHWIPDGSPVGINSLTAGRVRGAAIQVGMTEAQTLEALRPFAEVGRHIPEKARNWDWGTSGLKYGDFLRARELCG
jgi:hypothetical protein